MDLEAVQLLNLSPIPELSEIELSTMLEQLSGLSDLNGDITDRNVEDILKEAEDLLDQSFNSGINQSISLVTNPEVNNQETSDINPTQSKETEGKPEVESKEVTKHHNSPVKIDTAHNTNKVIHSPVEQLPNRIFSPGGSANPIKSAIDSLNEFSSLIEKQLSSRSENSSPKEKSVKKTIKFEKVSAESQSNERTKPVLRSPQLKLQKKNSESAHLDKSVKMLNCFERLYQDRPVRLLNSPGKVKTNVPKTIAKKKSKIVDRKQTKSVTKQDEKLNQSFTLPEPDYVHEVEEWLKISKVSSEAFLPKNVKCTKNEESEIEFSKSPKANSSCGETQRGSKLLDEKLILRLLQEMEEIKEQVKKAGVGDVPEVMRESRAVIDRLRSEVESVKEKVSSESMKNTGIERLEEQFALLKNKYDQHMERLEAENVKLREALSNQQKFYGHRISGSSSFSTEAKVPPGTIPSKTSIPGSPSSSKSKMASTDNPSTPKNSPVSLSSPNAKDVQTSSEVKEASSQTETELRNASIQCVQERSEDGASQTESEDKKTFETTKTENKENVSMKKKPGKCRPFSDVNVHQLMRQKRTMSDHETRLMVTLRGLQAEVAVKDKETRKLKTEIDVLKTQIKKLTRVKGEVSKRCHTGTQTIGLGPITQRPYNPKMYEAPNELEKENEELKLKIKQLEEDYELLREKRVSDLQSLHQVHEEEMAKLVSKLETQSALTKHLHSLLVNR